MLTSQLTRSKGERHRGRFSLTGEREVRTPNRFQLVQTDPKTYRHTHTYTVLHYLDLFYIDCLTLVLDVCLYFLIIRESTYKIIVDTLLNRCIIISLTKQVSIH